MKYLKKLTIVAVITCSAATVMAGIVSAEGQGKLTAANAEPTGKTNPVVSARDTSNLRCWQYGELLFEQTHLDEKKLVSADNMMVFTSHAKGSDREVYLINTGSATCLYEKI